MTKVSVIVVGLVMIAVSGVTSNAHADNCVNGICVGKLVIDQNEYVGTVNAVGDELVTYTVPGYNPASSQPSRLSPEVSSKDGLSAGVVAIDSNEYIGKVTHVFANGKTQYVVPGYNPGISSVEKLSAEVPAIDGIASGVTVIDPNEYIGKVNRVFANRKVQYTVSGYNPAVSTIDKLSLLVPSLSQRSEIHAGVEVIDDNEYIGTVSMVFANGKVRYTVPGYNPAIKSIQQLSAAVDGLDVFKTGSVVIDRNDYIGKTLKFFANRKVQYQIPGYNPAITSVGNLSIQVLSRGALQPGKLVIDDNEYVGSVAQLFADGRVQYVVPGYNPSIKSEKLLSHVVTSVEGSEDLVANTTVVDSNDYIGTVKNVFANGKVQYVVPGYNPGISTVKLLSPEVDHHPSAVKGTNYADESFRVGKANRFFKNEKVELVSEQTRSFVALKLFPKVDQLNGYSENSEVALSHGKIGRVLEVFQNGALLCSVTVEGPDKKPLERKISVKMHGVVQNAQVIKEDKIRWLLDLARAVEADGLWAQLGFNPRMGIAVAEMPRLASELLTLLSEEEKIIYGEKTREKVVELLKARLANVAPGDEPGTWWAYRLWLKGAKSFADDGAEKQ